MARPLVLVFLVDALGWEIAEHFGFGRDEFRARAPLGTVFGYSSAAIPSLLSGTTPVDHGSWSMFKRAEAGGAFAFLTRIPPLPHGVEWRARRWIQRYASTRAGIRAYYSLYEVPVHLLHRFDLGLKGDPFQPGGLARETVFDWMRSRGVRYHLGYYTSAEEDNFAAAEAAVASDADVIFVYTAELDALMHRAGIFHESVGARLRRYAAFLSTMQARARANDRSLTTILLSDHGMTDVTRVVNPWRRMDADAGRLGRDYLAFFDSTMVRVWGSTRATDAALAGMEGAGRLVGDAELRALGCDFPAHDYGDAVVVADPGVLIVPSFMGAAPLAAMHGYHPDDAFSKGVFMSDDESSPPPSLLGFKQCFIELVERTR